MKKSFLYFKYFFLIALFFLIKTTQAQTEEQLIQQTIYAQQTAWNNGSVDGYMDYYWQSDSLQFVSKNGVTYGWEKVKNNYKKSYNSKEKMGVLSFENLKIELLSKENPALAHVTGSWKVEQADKNILSGYFSLVFKKINGKWLIIIDHTS